MKFNDQDDEQVKQHEEFIDKIKNDMVNINSIPASTFENINPNSMGLKYTIIDSIKIDSVVVWKGDIYNED